MFYCNDCGALFEKPVPIKEYLDAEELGYLLYHGCPNCRSDQIDVAAKCDLCGRYVTEGYVVLEDGTVACDNCYTRY